MSLSFERKKIHQKAACIYEHHCSALYLSVVHYFHIHTWRKGSTGIWNDFLKGTVLKGLLWHMKTLVGKKTQHSHTAGFKGTTLRAWVLVLYIGICSNHIFLSFFSYYANFLQSSVNGWNTTIFTPECSVTC